MMSHLSASMISIALFGTSADPPHQGHRAILSWLATQFDHVAVWVANNPFKQHQSDLSDRVRMLELLIEGVHSERVQLHPELSHMRSIVSIERAKAIWPEAKFTLVVGADLVSQLPSWHRAADIFAAVDILVAPRPGYALKEYDLQALRSQARVTLGVMPEQHDVSSTRARQDEDEVALPAAIQAYIHQHKLYLCQDDSKRKLSMR